MVYSFITPTTEYHGYYEPARKGKAAKDEYSKPRYTVLERQGLSVALLATSKFVKSEAQPYFDKKFALMKLQPMRFTVDLFGTAWLTHDDAEGQKCFEFEGHRQSRSAVHGRPSARMPLVDTGAPVSELLATLSDKKACGDSKKLIKVAAETIKWVKAASRSVAYPYAVEIMINDNIKNMNLCEFERMDIGTDTIVESDYLTMAITAKVDAGPRLRGLYRGAQVHVWKRRARLRSEQMARRDEVDWFSIKT
jgi:hypothetical protein